MTNIMKRTVKKTDVDDFGHVGYASFFRWYKEGQDNLRQGCIKHSDIYYLRELFLGDIIQVHTIAVNSLRYRQRIVRGTEIVSEATTLVARQEPYTNYTSYFSKYKQAHEDFLSKAGIGDFKKMEKLKLRTLVINSEVRFFEELSPNDKVYTIVDNIGNSSMEYSQSITGETLVSEAIIKVAWQKSKKKYHLPDEMKKQLAKTYL